MMVIRHAALATVPLAAPFIGERVIIFRRPCAAAPISTQLKVHDDLLRAKDISRIWAITGVLFIGASEWEISNHPLLIPSLWLRILFQIIGDVNLIKVENFHKSFGPLNNQCTRIGRPILWLAPARISGGCTTQPVFTVICEAIK